MAKASTTWISSKLFIFVLLFCILPLAIIAPNSNRRSGSHSPNRSPSPSRAPSPHRSPTPPGGVRRSSSSGGYAPAGVFDEYHNQRNSPQASGSGHPHSLSTAGRQSMQTNAQLQQQWLEQNPAGSQAHQSHTSPTGGPLHSRFSDDSSIYPPQNSRFSGGSSTYPGTPYGSGPGPDPFAADPRFAADLRPHSARLSDGTMSQMTPEQLRIYHQMNAQDTLSGRPPTNVVPRVANPQDGYPGGFAGMQQSSSATLANRQGGHVAGTCRRHVGMHYRQRDCENFIPGI